VEFYLHASWCCTKAARERLNLRVTYFRFTVATLRCFRTKLWMARKPSQSPYPTASLPLG